MLTLRQKKLIKTKHDLAQAFAKKLSSERFDEISIKDICQKMEVSEASFYNYFPQKIDVIAYLYKAKMFKTYAMVRPLLKTRTFKECIEKTFELITSEIKHPFIFFEILTLIGMHKKHVASFHITEKELACIFPDVICEKIPMVSLQEFFEELIEAGYKAQDIPEYISKKTLAQFLMTILTGVPLSTPHEEFSRLGEIYQTHLSLLWKIFHL